MAILGNLFLVLAALIFFGMLSLLFGNAPRTGDAGVGYAWSLILLNLGFVVCMVVVTLTIAAQGGFAWISEQKNHRFWWVAGGLTGALVTTAFSSLLRNELGPAIPPVRWLASALPVLMPIMLIATGLMLVNTGIRESVSETLYKLPVRLIGIIGLTGLALLLSIQIVSSFRNQAAMIRDQTSRIDSNQQRMIDDITAVDVSQGIYSLLIYSGHNQDREVWTRAVDKIKSHPDWQAELIRLLHGNASFEVFQFLAYNDVDDPARFAEPVRQGILYQAEAFRKRIRNCSHSSHFYKGMFSYEIERVLLTADRYKGHGVDYRDAIKELLAALHEPSDFGHTLPGEGARLEKWLKKNE